MFGEVLGAPSDGSSPSPLPGMDNINFIKSRLETAVASDHIRIDHQAYDQKPRRRFSIDEYNNRHKTPQITKEEAHKLAKQELIALTLKAKRKQDEIQRATNKLAVEEKERRMFGKFQKVSQPRNRQLWNVGTHVLIQKDGSGQWFHGTIVKIHENYSSEEVLNILYYEFNGNTKYKTVRRYDECVKAPNEDAWEVFDMEDREKTLYEHIFKGKDVPTKLMDEVLHRSKNHSRVGTAFSNIMGNTDGNIDEDIYDQSGIDYTVQLERIDGVNENDANVNVGDEEEVIVVENHGKKKKNKKKGKKKKNKNL